MKHNVNEIFVNYLISHQAVRKLIPEFMAKNQLAAEGARSFLDFRVLALKECLYENVWDEKVLCPVRALRYYLTCVRKQDGSWKLFVSIVACHTSEIHPKTISGWILKCIIECFSLKSFNLFNSTIIEGFILILLASNWTRWAGLWRTEHWN